MKFKLMGIKKKLLALGLILCLGLESVFVVFADTEYLNETFEDLAAEQAPLGWNVSGADGYSFAKVTENDGNKAVLLKAAASGFPSVSHSFNTVKGAFIAEGKVSVMVNAGSTSLRLIDKKGASASLVTFESDSQIYAVSGNTSKPITSYSLNKWYRIALSIDTTQGVYSLLIDGEDISKNHYTLPKLAAKGAEFDYADGIAGIAVDAYQGADSGYTSALWDDLRVYPGSSIKRDEQFETTKMSTQNIITAPEESGSSIGKWGFANGQNIIMLPDRTAIAADSRMLSYDRFIDDFTGRLPRFGWNNYTKGNIATIEYIGKDGNEQNKAIRMEAVNSDPCNEMKVFSDDIIDEDFTVEAKFYVETLGATHGINLTQSPHACPVVTLSGTGDIIWQNGEVLGSYTAGQWVEISFAVYFSQRKADCYINGVKAAEQKAITFNGTGFDAVRFHSTGGVSYLDDIYIYKGTAQLDTEAIPDGTFVTYKNLMNDDAAVISRLGEGTIAMKIDSGIAYVNGRRTTIDADRKNVSPILHNKNTIVPVRFILENLGYTVNYNESTQNITASNGDIEIVISLSDGIMYSSVDGNEKRYECLVMDGRCLIPIRVLANWTGKRIYWNDDGVCILGDNPNLFDATADAELVEKLYKMLTFARPTGNEILADIRAKFPNYGHNRLYLTDERIQRIMNRYNAGDPNTVYFVNNTISQARANIGTNALDYAIPDGKRLLDVSRTMEGRFILYATAYRLSGDTDNEIAQQCWKEMQHIASYPNWNETHFLDTSEMCRGFAIAYDTLYDWMDEEQRELCVQTIKEKALYPALYEYRYGNGATHSEWANSWGNWNPVCNAGMMIGAIAIAEDDEELAAEILESALIGLEGNLVQFAPDGAWPEGPGYWHYTIEFISYALDSLFTATGGIYNYLNVAGIGETAKYYMYMMGPGGTFNYGDMLPQYVKSPELYWYAEVLQDGTLAYLYKSLADEYNFGNTSRTAMLHYDEALAESGEGTVYPYDAYFRKWWVGSLKTSWNIADATYIAFQGGRPNAGHSQMEIGNFVMDALGERWAIDLGYDNYNIGYLGIDENARAWWIYRKSTEGNNCFLINPDDKHHQVYDSDSPITVFKSEELGGYSVIDLSTAYARVANRALRGFKIDRATETVTVQDEFEVKTPNSEYYWFMHTKADIDISEDGKSAVLSQNGKRLYIEIKAPSNGRFSIMETKVLPTSGDSGVRELEAENEGVSKLAIHLTGLSGKNTVSVSMVGLKDASLTQPLSPFPSVVAIDNWSIPTEKLEFARLGNIKVDGNALETFATDRYNYTIKLPFGTDEPPAVSAEGDAEVTQADKLPGSATIKAVEDGKVDSYYLVSFKVQPLLDKEPDNLARIKIKKVTASQVPQEVNSPENTLDGDYATRWAGNGEAWIQFELDAVRTISSFMTSWMAGDKRLQYFDMQASVDGQEWITLFSGESSGETAGPECYMIDKTKAKYVRLKVHGTSEGSWTSLQEFAVYGE